MSSEEKPPIPTQQCYPILVPVTSLEEYDVVYEGPDPVPCPPGITNYALIPNMESGTVYSKGCMTPAQADQENDKYCVNEEIPPETLEQSFDDPEILEESFEKPPCYPYLVPISNLDEYDIVYTGPAPVPCPSGQTNYAVILPPGTEALYVGCMTSAQAEQQNDESCKQNETYAESFEEPKMANQNSKCDGNNFIESETGYRQATQCVCAPYKSSHIHFVT